MDDISQFVSSTAGSLSICDISLLKGAYSTIPRVIEQDLVPSQISDRVCDEDGPAVVEIKEQGYFFLTASLHEGPLIGKTRLRYPEGTIGKMRSASHVDPSSWFPFDLDGLSEAQLATIRERLLEAGIRHVFFSTHSNGRQDKPGLRARLLLFADRRLAPEEWVRVWHAINQHLLDGLADPATASLAQQAGCWATSQDRVPQAFRYTGGKRLLNANALLAAAPPAKPKSVIPSMGWRGLASGGHDDPKTLRQLPHALDWLDANDYPVWMRTLGGLKGLVATGRLTEATAQRLWLTWSETATAAAQAHNDDARYNPEHLWDCWVPTAPPEALIGTLFVQARDRARDTAQAEVRNGNLSPRGEQAARYLAEFHPAEFQALLRTVQHGA